MALMKCPECGKEVSDSAVACPNCGFGVREYMEKKRVEEEKQAEFEQQEKRQQEEYRKKQEEEKIRKETELERQRETLERLDKSAKANKWFIGITWVVLIGGIILYGLKDWGFCMFVAVIAGIIIFAWYGYLKNNAESNRKLAETDFNAYEQKIESYKDEQKSREEEAKRQEEKQEELSHPVCPMCGSKNTHRISTVSRVVSAEMLGLGSKKIGKQYECLDCKHMW